jgi:acyl carrier protein phosphodiesterase
MNFLAHCLLAQANGHSLVGNLLGDFCKGVDTSSLPRNIYLGLMNHRAVDKFTDQHLEVLKAKQYFSTHRRRFAGIAIDVLFDHFLIKHWSLFCEISFEEFKKQTYHYLIDNLSLMPSEMASVITRVVQQDWFASYQQIGGVGLALDRIASRIRFKNQFSGCLEDIELHLDELETAFNVFFPQLQSHIHTLTLENP